MSINQNDFVFIEMIINCPQMKWLINSLRFVIDLYQVIPIKSSVQLFFVEIL